MSIPVLIGYKKLEASNLEEIFLVFSPSVKEAMCGPESPRNSSFARQVFAGEACEEMWNELKKENKHSLPFFTAGPTFTMKTFINGLKTAVDKGNISNLQKMIPLNVVARGKNIVMLEKKNSAWIMHTDQDFIRKEIRSPGFEAETKKGIKISGFISDSMFYRLTKVVEGLDVKKAVSTVTIGLLAYACTKGRTDCNSWEDLIRIADPSKN